MLNSLSHILTWLDISLVTTGLSHPVCCDFARIIEYEVAKLAAAQRMAEKAKKKRDLGSTNTSTMDATWDWRGTRCKMLKGKRTAKIPCELNQNIESKSHFNQQL